MSALLLDGVALSDRIRAELKPRVAEFRARVGRAPGLAIVLAGDDPASQVYVRNKERAGADAGLAVTIHRLPATAALSGVVELVEQLNRRPDCDAILVQSPLPIGMGRRAAQAVFDVIDPAKDVDGFHPLNVGLLAQGRPALAPCTPSGVIELLDRERIDIAGRHAVVIGRSEIVGRPMAALLLMRDATVTICHSRTRDLAAVCRTGDLLVAAIGRPGFVTPAFVQPGAVVIDVGINRLDSREDVVRLFGAGSARVAAFDRKGSVLAGDVHPDVESVAGALTPVPGGVGPLTIAMLLKNTMSAALAREPHLPR
jgi:methylenetetrahydrofolate dehydrogenase (NADP+)/methenyltetrahydrofolate cyclohydrolase